MIVGHSDRWATTRCGSAVAWLASKTLMGEYLVGRTFDRAKQDIDDRMLSGTQPR